MKPTVLFLGSLPPPYMGPTVATEIILGSRITETFEIVHLDTSDHRDLTHLGAFDLTNVVLAMKHYRELLRLISRSKPDLVYVPISQTTIGFLRDAGFIIISTLLRRKIVCHLRGGNFGNWVGSAIPLTRAFVRFVLGRIEGMIVLGERLKAMFAGYLPEEKVYVVPNGADYKVNFERGGFQGKTNLLYVGNLQASKGIEDVIEAVSLLSGDGKIQLTVVGEWRDWETRKRCLELCDTEDLPVRMVPAIRGEERFRYYEEADIFVFPPREPEGLPWVIVEALAAGLPIITTDQGAITETVLDGENGFIVSLRSPELLAGKINRLLMEPELMKSMSRRSREIYQSGFTEEHMVHSLSLCFENILAAGGVSNS
jgi:glycosyltransferase involved in cell wall biosynthesis